MKKKSILIVLAMLFVLIAVTPIRESFAYFTAYDEASGEAAVTLKWETEIVEEIDENQKDKHIVIKNTGDTPVIVRVNVLQGITPSHRAKTANGQRIQADGGTTPRSFPLAAPHRNCMWK